MYPYLTKKGKQMLVFLTHFRITTVLIYRNKILQICLLEFIIKLFSHAFFFVTVINLFYKPRNLDYNCKECHTSANDRSLVQGNISNTIVQYYNRDHLKFIKCNNILKRHVGLIFHSCRCNSLDLHISSTTACKKNQANILYRITHSFACLTTRL